MADLIQPDRLIGGAWSGTPLYAAIPAPARSVEDIIFVPQRLFAFGLAFLLAYGAIFAGHVWLRDWPLTDSGSPRFIDFISFWINAKFALTVAAADAYQYAAFAAAQAPYVTMTRGDYPYYHLVYPPTLFPLVAPIGLLPFVAALTAWIAATGGLYLLAVFRAVPRVLACLLAVLPFAVVKNVWLGQASFLVAGLLGLSLGLMEKRPFVAGLCLGLLTCKPQYGIIFPIVLLVTGQWRVIAGACVSFAALIATVTGLYGVAIWRAYLGAFGTSSLDNFMTDNVLDAIDQTVFGVMHWFGAGFAAKWSVHLVAAALMTAFVCVVCRRPTSGRLKAAALGVGALFVTPYMMAYDLTGLTIPAAFLAQEGLATGFLPGERLTLLACFLGLFLMQTFPVGPLILAALMALVLRRVFPGRARCLA
jgi:hypothetical protein